MGTEGNEPHVRPETPRSFMRDGAQWLAYEMHRPYDRRSSRVLIFESPDALRVVRQFPVGWRELSDEELWTLSWKR